jgi:hypothetical protein
MPRTAFIPLIMMLCWMIAPAATTAGGDADAAVSIGLSARAQALGDAGCGLYGDALNIFYNPASTAMLTRTEIDLHYQRPYNDISDMDRQAIALSVPLLLQMGAPGNSSSLGTITLSLARFHNGGIPEADETGLTGREFGETVLLSQISYANHISRMGAIGISFKTLSHKVEDRTGSGFGMDVGFDWTPKNLTVGFAIINAVSPLVRLGSQADFATPRFRLGVAYAPVQVLNIVLDGELDSILTYDGAAGLEILPLPNYDNPIAIRAGYRLSTKSITAGLGFRLDGPFMDIGYSQHDELGAGESATVGWRIAPPPPPQVETNGDGENGTDGVQTIQGTDGNNTVPVPGGDSAPAPVPDGTTPTPVPGGTTPTSGTGGN